MNTQTIPKQDAAIAQYEMQPGQSQDLHQRQQNVMSQNDDAFQTAPSGAMKNYDMMYSTSRCNVKMHLGSSSGPIKYYAQSVLLSKNPALHLRAGDSKKAPVVAFAQCSYVSRHMTMGLGDIEKNKEGALVWEDLLREQNVLRRGDYQFSASVEGGPRTTYKWRRDRSASLKTIYHCIDEQGMVIAHMYSGGMLNFNKGGEFKVLEDMNESLERLLMISALAVWVFEASWSYSQGYAS